MLVVAGIVVILLLGLYFTFREKDVQKSSDYNQHKTEPGYTNDKISVSYTKPDPNFITRHFPKIFDQDRDYPLATDGQLRFLDRVGFDISKTWTKEAASFALTTFKMIKIIFEDGFEADATDKIAIDIIKRAFKNKDIALLFLQLHQHENEAYEEDNDYEFEWEDCPQSDDIFDWMNEEIAPIYDV